MLDPLMQLAADGRSPADALLDAWAAEPEALVRAVA